MNPVSVFRCLLALSVLLIISGLISEYLTSPTLPEPLANYLAEDAWWAESNGNEVSGGELALIGVLIPILLLALAGYIGLFMLKSWGRACFIISGIAAYLAVPFLGPSVMSGISYALYDLTSVTMGAIVAMSYLSPVKDHLEGTATPQSA